MHSSSSRQTIEELRQEELKALEIFKEQMVDFCNNLEVLYNDLRPISKKIAQKEKELIKRQIEKIPNQIQTL